MKKSLWQNPATTRESCSDIFGTISDQPHAVRTHLSTRRRGACSTPLAAHDFTTLLRHAVDRHAWTT